MPCDSHAFVTTACSAADVESAALLHRSLRATGSKMTTIAITHGLTPEERALLSRSWQDVRDMTNAINITSAFRPITQPSEGLFWPTRALDRTLKFKSAHQSTKGDRMRTRHGYVLAPSNATGCSTLKLFAWSLIERSGGVFLAEPDATLHGASNPDTWIHEYRHRLPWLYFAAAYRNLSSENGRPSNTSRGAGSDGLYASLLWLRPNTLVHRLLADKARTQAFLPRTNTIIDVIETAMPMNACVPTLAHATWRMPRGASSRSSACGHRPPVAIAPTSRSPPPWCLHLVCI